MEDLEYLSEEPLLTTAGSRKRHKVSYVWAHVRQYDADRDRNSNAGKSQCRFCLHWFSASINASGWKRHLLNHGIKDPASQSDSSHNSSGLRLSKQTLLPSPPNPKETAFLHNSVVDYVVTSLSPHNVVECTAFKKLISTFRPGYILQSARTIGRRVLELYVITLPLIAAFLQDLPFKFSLSFDGWTNAHMKGFYIVTIHFVDPAIGKLRCMLLNVFRPDPGDGVGKRLSIMLFDFLSSLGDNVLQKVRAIVTDNGSDAIAAGNYFVNLCKERCSEDPKFQPCWLIRCVDHSIQLAVNEALRFINQINDKLRCILPAIRHSKTRREAFRKEAALRNQTSLEPPCLDSKTRWGSTHEMSSQSYDKRKIIDHCVEAFDDLQDYAISTEEWRRIGHVAKFLKPIREIMEGLSAETSSTISMVQDQIDFIFNHCEQAIISSFEPELIKLAAQSMMNKLGTYRSKLTGVHTKIAEYLDPRLEKPYDPDERNELKSFIRQILITQYGFQLSQDGVVLANACPVEASGSALLLRRRRLTQTLPMQDEVDKFLNVYENEDVDLISYWICHAKAYPYLFLLAMDVLAIPSSSTAVERANSEAGREYSDHRMSLSPNMFTASMCVRSWMNNGLEPPKDRHSAAKALSSDFSDRLLDLQVQEDVQEIVIQEGHVLPAG